MRLIFVDIPGYLKNIIFFISIVFKDTYFLNMSNLSSSEYLFKKKIKPLSFENKEIKSIEKFIFGNNSNLEKHLKSFFFFDLELKLKKYFNNNYSKKAIYLSLQQMIIPLSNYTGKLKIWLENNKKKKTFIIFFHSKFFFSPPINNNSIKIILPLNFFSFNFFFIIFKKIFFKLKEEKNIKKENLKKNYKPILYLVNKSIIYGSKKYRLFKKDVLLDNTSNIEKYLDIFFVGKEKEFEISLKKKIKYFFQSFFFFFSSFFKVRKFKHFLCIIFFIKIIFLKKKFHEIFKNKNYKCCYVDYDILMPSYIYLALKSLKVKVFSYQERFNLGFKTCRIAIFCDHYFVNNPYQVKFLAKSPYITAKTFEQVGQIKSEYLQSLKKNKNKNKKKTIVIFGYNSPINKYRAFHEPLINWESQKIFLRDIITISKKFQNHLFIIRFKSLEWLTSNKYFSKEFKNIKKTKNLKINTEYTYEKSYKICSTSDLIISRWSSIVDEALCARKSVLVYNYTGKSTNIIKNYFNYGKNINCNNLNELIDLIKKKLENKKYEKYDFKFSKKYYGFPSRYKNFTKTKIRKELLKFVN